MKTTPSKDIPIELDKKRNLRLTLEGMCRFEEEFGTSILDTITELFPEGESQQLTARQMRILPKILWAELVHEDENLTVADVNKMIDIGNVVPLFTKIAEVFALSMPDATMKGEAEGESVDPGGKGKK